MSLFKPNMNAQPKRPLYMSYSEQCLYCGERSYLTLGLISNFIKKSAGIKMNARLTTFTDKYDNIIPINDYWVIPIFLAVKDLSRVHQEGVHYDLIIDHIKNKHEVCNTNVRGIERTCRELAQDKHANHPCALYRPKRGFFLLRSDVN